MFRARISILREAPNIHAAWNQATTEERGVLKKTTQEVLLELHTLKWQKTPGSDGTRNKHLKDAFQLHAKSRCSTDVYGRAPAVARCYPSCNLKRKRRSERPIILARYRQTSSFYKLLDSLLTKISNRYFEETELIPPMQYGFKTNSSMMTACSILPSYIKCAIVKPKQVVFAVFVDIKAAFDTETK